MLPGFLTKHQFFSPRWPSNCVPGNCRDGHGGAFKPQTAAYDAAVCDTVKGVFE
jgi:hypothetical protein